MHDPYIIIGKVGAVYGVHGWIKIRTFTETNENILAYDPWYLSKDQKHWEVIQREDGKIQGELILAKFKGIDTPEAARLLTNHTIAILRNQLPTLKSKEYYWSDLAGLTVINQSGEVYGTVAYLMETGSNDVLVIKNNQNKEYAIPFLMGTVILEVNLTERIIRVNWELI